MKKELKEKLGEDYSISTKNGTLPSYQAKMREKKLLLSMIILFLTISGCRKQNEEWKRNPNLRLLLKKEGKSLFNPVWAPNGKKIYYLITHGSGMSYAKGGDLEVVNTNGSNNVKLLDGPFCALAISPNGDKLALSHEQGETEVVFEGGPLILVDTLGNILDTLPTSLPKILDVEFNLTGDRVFYYAYSEDTSLKDSFGFYSINIDGSDEKLERIEKKWEEIRWRGFDLDTKDSIIYSNVHPQVNLIKEVYIVYVTGDIPLLIGIPLLKMINTTSDETIELDADPYSPPGDVFGGFQSAYWSPDGNKLVISVGEVQGGCPPASVETLELWILDKVW